MKYRIITVTREFGSGGREIGRKVSERLGIKSDKEALEMMRDVDKKRSIHHKYFTDREGGKSQYYGMCLSSSQLGLDNCVSLICETYHGGDR